MIEDVFQPVKLKLSELLRHRDNYLASLTTKRPETIGTYERSLREFVQFFVKDGRFMFRVRDVERYRKHLAVTKKMQDASIATYMTALRRLCQYMVEVGVLEKNPAKRVHGSPRAKQHNRTFLTLDEIQTLLNAIDTSTTIGKRDNALIRLMLGCACSEVEITAMDIGDIRQHGKASFLLVQGKGKSIKDERVPVPQEALHALHVYLATRYTTDPQGNIEPPPPEAPMFVSYSNRSMGKRMTIRGVREAVMLRLKESGVQKGRTRRLTPFSLRHTAGILMVESGASVEELMERMRITWRPTAMLYFQQKGKLRSDQRTDLRELISVS
ncbi:MAG: tyrosine-type recombinase/integrase [Bacteroidota bacterium]|nr:site-specific integrase [Candidatus Kapabacteria bacterium]MDW8220379.1 tyrosine-type recombinase/integrase [Bacteroidota bacterium]